MGENDFYLILDAVVGENLVNIDLTNLGGWIEETLRKEQNLLKSTASFIKEPKSTIQHWKWAKMTYICFWVHWLVEHAPKFGKYGFTKFGRLTAK